MSQSEVQICLDNRKDCIRAVIDPEFNRLHGRMLGDAVTLAYSTDISMADRQPDPYYHSSDTCIKLPPLFFEVNNQARAIRREIQDNWHRYRGTDYITIQGIDALGQTSTVARANKKDLGAGCVDVPLIQKNGFALPIKLDVSDNQALISEGSGLTLADQRLDNYRLNPKRREELEEELVMSLIAQSAHLTQIKDDPHGFASDLIGTGLYTDAPRLMTDKELADWNSVAQNIAFQTDARPTIIDLALNNIRGRYSTEPPILTIDTHPLPFFLSIPAIRTQPTLDHYFRKLEDPYACHTGQIEPEGPTVSFSVEVIRGRRHLGNIICRNYYKNGTNSPSYSYFDNGGRIVGLYEHAKNQLRANQN